MAELLEPCTGWLEKKTGGKEEQEASKKKSIGQMRKKWDRRYCVILPSGATGAGGQMMYFKADQDWQKGKQPKGILNLEDAELLLADSTVELEFAVRCTKPPASKGGGLALAFPSRVYVFRAANPAERERFVGVLRGMIPKVQEGVDRRRLSAGLTTTMRYTQGFEEDAAEDEYNQKGGGAKQVAKQRKEWFAFFRAQKKRQVVKDAPHPELVMERPPLALCRAGIPPQYRGQIWTILSGSAALRYANAGTYGELCGRSEPAAGELKEETDVQIEKDLSRTFAENTEMQQGERVSELRRLLRAYAIYDPEVGYCQSLNFIAAILMLYMKEEEAFWTLVCVVQTLLPVGYYTDGMQGLRADHRVLQELVAKKLPALFTHLAQLDVPLEAVSTQWLMCMYLNVLPMNSVLRIWDAIFAEGSGVLMRVAVGLLKQHEAELLACTDHADAFMILQDMTKGDIDCERLMATAFSDKLIGAFPPTEMDELRKRGAEGIRAEDAAASEAKAAREAEKLAAAQAKAEVAARVAAAAGGELRMDLRPELGVEQLSFTEVPGSPAPDTSDAQLLGEAPGGGEAGTPAAEGAGVGFALEEELARGREEEEDSDDAPTPREELPELARWLAERGHSAQLGAIEEAMVQAQVPGGEIVALLSGMDQAELAQFIASCAQQQQAAAATSSAPEPEPEPEPEPPPPSSRAGEGLGAGGAEEGVPPAAAEQWDDV